MQKDLRTRFQSLRKRALRWLLVCATSFFVGSLGLVLVFRFAPVPVTPLMVLRSFEALLRGEFLGIRQTWVSLRDVSPHLQKAIIAAEDRHFFEHHGFDFEAIEKALQANKKRATLRGASTISQQTAKNVFLWPQRSWTRKAFEAYFTLMIEALWPKQRILEVYLNVIELGPGVYGVEAGAQKYFRQSARQVNRPQAALMAAVLPNPLRFRIDQPSRFVKARQKRLLRKLPTLAVGPDPRTSLR